VRDARDCASRIDQSPCEGRSPSVTAGVRPATDIDRCLSYSALRSLRALEPGRLQAAVIAPYQQWSAPRASDRFMMGIGRTIVAAPNPSSQGQKREIVCF